MFVGRIQRMNVYCVKHSVRNNTTLFYLSKLMYKIIAYLVTKTLRLFCQPTLQWWLKRQRIHSRWNAFVKSISSYYLLFIIYFLQLAGRFQLDSNSSNQKWLFLLQTFRPSDVYFSMATVLLLFMAIALHIFLLNTVEQGMGYRTTLWVLAYYACEIHWTSNSNKYN